MMMIIMMMMIMMMSFPRIIICLGGRGIIDGIEVRLYLINDINRYHNIDHNYHYHQHQHHQQQQQLSSVIIIFIIQSSDMQSYVDTYIYKFIVVY